MVDNTYSGPGEWTLTNDIYQNNGVFYRCWCRPDGQGGSIYSLNTSHTIPPGPGYGGYASFESCVYAKFGKRI